MTKYFYSEIENSILEILKKDNNKSEQKISLKQIFPTITERNIDQLIEILTNNARIREDISSYKEIKLDSIGNSEQFLNKIIDLVNFLKGDDLLSKPKLSMHVGSPGFSVEDITIIEIKTNTNLIQSWYYYEKMENQILKTAWNKFYSKNIDEISEISIINEVMEEINNKEKNELNFQYYLRILSKFKWSRISEEYTELNTNFKNLFQQDLVKSESYHLKKEEDLHYYMMKATPKNAHFWDEFIEKQRKIDKEKDNSHYAGLVAFSPSLQWFEYNKTDVWIAFIANQEVDLDQINYFTIEMFVTMITSENACFTSHSGISRCPSYTGKIHPKISADLHSFIAKATLKNYGLDQKSYMITCPVGGMREIIIKTFEKRECEKYIYIGNETTNFQHTISGLRLSSNYNDVIKLIERINNQNKDIEEEKKKILIKINAETKIKIKDDNYDECTSFEILNQEGEILQIITTEMMVGEFAWFFKHPYLFKGQNNSEVLLTADMKVLAGFIDNPDSPIEIEYAAEIEMVGDSIPY